MNRRRNLLEDGGITSHGPECDTPRLEEKAAWASSTDSVGSAESHSRWQGDEGANEHPPGSLPQSE